MDQTTKIIQGFVFFVSIFPFSCQFASRHFGVHEVRSDGLDHDDYPGCCFLVLIFWISEQFASHHFGIPEVRSDGPDH